MATPRIHALLLGAACASVSDFTGAIHGHNGDTSATGSQAPPRPLTGGEEDMSADMRSTAGWLSFRRMVDVPFEMYVAALESWQRTIGQDGELRIGGSRLRGPIERDRDTGTCRIGVRLARGPLRPLLRMRLDIDRWSSSSTAFELIPCGRVRPTAPYFRAGHLLLDSLTGAVPQQLPAAHTRRTTSQPHALSGPMRPPHRRGAVMTHPNEDLRSGGYESL